MSAAQIDRYLELVKADDQFRMRGHARDIAAATWLDQDSQSRA
jgi:hypothetical protein